jgi:sialic acid synthase SpsE
MLFCAEIGSGHRGVPSLAYEMIRQASLAGADLVKFQLGHWKPKCEDCIQYARRWPTENAKWLKQQCDFWGVEFFASIFSMEGLEVARKIGQKRYKMASRTAFASHSDEDYTVLFGEMMIEGKEIYASGRESGVIHQNVKGVYVVPEYPQYPPIRMPEDFKGEGYSSHVHGYADALIAIARGACYIEKHVTLDKTLDNVKDNHFALTFTEFSEMTKIGREMERYL